MKSKTTNLAILLVIGLVFPLLLNYSFKFSTQDNTKSINPKVSGGYNENFIHVIGTNWTDTLAEDWCYEDNGVYIIENVTIDASSSPTGIGILIYQSSADFIIRNCTIYNADVAGIKLNLVTNGIIYNNTCSNNGQYGIYLLSWCDENNILYNKLHGNGGDYFGAGIYLSQDCMNNNITNNVLNNNTKNGISLFNDCGYNNITGNTANDNGQNGILLTNDCDDNTISGNTVSDNMGYGIQISFFEYSSDNNTIINNTAIENSLSGIYLEKTENNTITGNNVYENYRHGIHLKSNAKWNNITKNIIHDNTVAGIYLESTSDNNTIKNNTISRNDLGVLLSFSSYNNVSDNNIQDNNWCIFETGCTGNIIINNDCTPPTVQEPIFIDGIASGIGAHNWTWAINQGLCTGSGTREVPYVIENLLISGFGIMNGIEIWNSDVYFIIQQCEIYNSKTAGIYFNNVSNSQLNENNCSNNLGSGILLYEDCIDNNVTYNVAIKNDGSGIVLYKECDFNEIMANVVNDNDNDGIFIGDLCDNNTISNNIASNNGETGIELEGGGLHSSYNNTISQNAVNNNEYGIRLQFDCHFNKISENVIKRNNFGIFFEDSGCSNNLIYKNFFLKNQKHAEDDGIDNYWNSTKIGNYWDNWTSPDTNDDGIVDTQYNISGTPGGIDYLPIAEDGPPTVSINSPSEGDAFSSSAPNFNVQIIDDYLDTIWYTLDGGSNNYTCTENGVINQTAWDGMVKGAITLTFYAKDIPGYIGSAEVDIIKDTVNPVIIINSPAEGDRFGKTAPLFNITVDDDNLDAIWYSFDGGLTTYAITNNTMLNQTAWAALAQGKVTITFYASDLAGNEASESVTVTKSVPSGLDPGVIITIIILSVVGGVVVISVVYIFMKKRTTP